MWCVLAMDLSTIMSELNKAPRLMHVTQIVIGDGYPDAITIEIRHVEKTELHVIWSFV